MHMLKTIIALSLLLGSSYGYSIFDLELFGGQRSATLEPDGGSSGTVTGTEYKAAAHLDPIPLVPVAFGLAMTSLSFSSSKPNLAFDKFEGSELSFEVMAWIPKMAISLEPYFKAGYTFAGSYDLKSTQTLLTIPVSKKVTYKPSGLDLAAGINFSPLPLIKLMLEVDKRIETLKIDKVEVAGISAAANGSDIKNDSLSFLLGVGVGL